MRNNPKRLVILDLIKKKKTDEQVSAATHVPLSTVRYYRRRYTDDANRRQRYTPAMIEALMAARKDGQLIPFCKEFDIPLGSVTRLVKAYVDAKAYLPALRAVGWFDPRSTRDCYAVGLGRNYVARSEQVLKAVGLYVKILRGAPWLYFKNAAAVARVQLGFEDEVAIFSDPQGWLKENKEKLKGQWQIVRRGA